MYSSGAKKVKDCLIVEAIKPFVFLKEHRRYRLELKANYTMLFMIIISHEI